MPERGIVVVKCGGSVAGDPSGVCADVACLAAGVPAVGLTGVDGALLTARRRGPQRTVTDGRKVITRGDHSGRITGVSTKLLDCLMNAGFLPVLSPPVLADDGWPGCRPC